MAQNVNRRGQYIHGSECKQERAVYTWLRMQTGEGSIYMAQNVNRRGTVAGL
jgi:hypothetical protein